MVSEVGPVGLFSNTVWEGDEKGNSRNIARLSSPSLGRSASGEDSMEVAGLESEPLKLPHCSSEAVPFLCVHLPEAVLEKLI